MKQQTKYREKLDKEIDKLINPSKYYGDIRKYPNKMWGFFHDPIDDFIENKRRCGTGYMTYAISKIPVNSGKVIVCLNHRREGNEPPIQGPFGNWYRPLVEDITICGYLIQKKGPLKFFKSKRVRIISESEKQSIESELRQKIITKKPNLDRINFWN